MPDNPHQATLERLLELHRGDLADLYEQARALRELLRRRPPWLDTQPKRPPSRSVLQRDLAGVERSIAKHEQIIGLGADGRVGDLLRTVADDRELAREAAEDPAAFAARHGLELPDTMVISMLVTGRDVSARISNFDPDIPFDITWTQDGFPAPPEADRPSERAMRFPPAQQAQ
ncbi:hypothetical protein [Streptomyces sp. NPDC057302]|uniref:hypothetical protein n=1 Tax=Streptomyces sp. NPDC057302 TaxID=3346094 RepID=UPI00363E84E7